MTQRPSAWVRPLAAVAAAVVPLIPLVIGLSLNAGSTPAKATTSAAHFSPVGVTRARSRPGLHVPAGSGSLVAVVVHSTRMRAAPGGRAVGPVLVRTPFGSPDAMWVRRVAGRWLGVVSPLAGNNRLGWIPAADVSLTRVDWALHVSLAARRLTVLEHGHEVRRYAVAIGGPASPTPTGHFAVTDRLSTGDPAGPYGCCILALSAVAPHAIQGWSGGNRIAIHSTPETSTIGDAVSHGCVRLTLAEGRWLLDHVPLGTPTVITS
jgi:hypothetical protein